MQDSFLHIIQRSNERDLQVEGVDVFDGYLQIAHEVSVLLALVVVPHLEVDHSVQIDEVEDILLMPAGVQVLELNGCLLKLIMDLDLDVGVGGEKISDDQLLSMNV